MDRVQHRLGKAVAASLLAAACSASRAGVALRPMTPAPAPTSTAPPSTTTSTSTSPPRPPGLGMGDSGQAVLAIEQRLSALHYDVGVPDGHFGPADTFAVIAFQKVHGLSLTGRATDDVLAAMATASDPPPLVPGGGQTRVEIDIPRQVLLLYEGNALVHILPVSTGSGQRYCVDGQCALAVTPGGSYRIFRKLLGVDVSKLGVLYNPLYFNGGIAIHGEPAVPSYPASHGCVRIPMNSSAWFYNEVQNGTPVYVIGGPNAAVPFHAPAPPAPITAPPPTAPPSTTTTPAAPTTTAVPRSTTTAVPRSTTTTVAIPTTTTTVAH